jgi:hypothetical protein
MKSNNTNIEYLFLVRSALQFKEDLTDISKVLDSLSEEQVVVIASYADSIKDKIRHIEEKLTDKFLKE